ncbi:MAG TPA: hypothetical protein DDY13_04690 [Cytophagales bacterium]|nr:hypothetical protein [Cytophagales bacterium]
MKIRIFVLSLLTLLFVLNMEVDAQSHKMKKGYLKKKNKFVSKYKGGSIHFTKNKRYLSFGVNVNALNYFGDLAPNPGIGSTDISFTRPGFGIMASYRYTPALSIVAGLNWGRLRGDDFESADPYDESGSYRYVRNLSFRNDIYEFMAGVQYDFIPNHGTFLNRLKIVPYAFAGVSLIYHNPKAQVPDVNVFTGETMPNAGEWVALKPLGTEGQYSDAYDVKPYSLIQPAIPLGIGGRFAVNQRLDLSLEIGYRILFTDYIDDVGGLYVDLGALDSDLARVMSDRSREEVAVNSGIRRDENAISEATLAPYDYVSKYNGETYRVYPGYGDEHPDNLRGDQSNDQLFVTTIRISYILTGSFQRAKFR